MIDFPPAVKHLISALRQLPSVGPRTAERLALHLLQNPMTASNLAETVHQAKNTIHPCTQCGFFADQDLCEICRDTLRDPHTLCIVEISTDILTFEKSGAYRGLYHVLHGTLSPLDGIGPEQLRIPQLLQRLKDQNITETILGLSPDVKGETTSLYLAQEIKNLGIKVSRLATGISVGGGLEFVDSVTLSHALNDRKPV